MHRTANHNALKRLDLAGGRANDIAASNTFAAPSVDSPLILTIGEVAELLKISVRSVNRLDSARWMPMPIRILGCKRWRRLEIEAWVAAGCPKSDNTP